MFVFAFVAFRLAMTQIRSGGDKLVAVRAGGSDVGDGDRCSNAGRVSAGAPNPDADARAALAEEVSQGIGCAAHSLRLVLQDLRGSVGFVRSAQKSVDKLLALYGGAPEKEG